MTILFLPLAALERDEATAKLCRQIPRLLGAQLEAAAAALGVMCRFLSSRGTAENGVLGLVATTELPAPSDLEATSRMYGADVVITGRFGLAERNMVFEARIFLASTRQEVYAKRFEIYPSYFFDATEELKIRIMQTLAIELADRERVALLSRPTDSWQALLYYLLAEDERYTLGIGIGTNDPVTTCRLYAEALTIDPEFKLAYEGLQHYIILLLQQESVDLSMLRNVIDASREFLAPQFLTEIEEVL